MIMGPVFHHFASDSLWHHCRVQPENREPLADVVFGASAPGQASASAQPAAAEGSDVAGTPSATASVATTDASGHGRHADSEDATGTRSSGARAAWDRILTGNREGSHAEPQPTETLLPEQRGSRLDDWFGRVINSPRRLQLWYWGAPALVTLLAAVLRLWNLGYPHSLIFDETFYVKDAYTLLNNGYESSWPTGADEKFAAGDTEIFLDSPSYVVHPPLGKWLIAVGLGAFGAGDAFGWRVSTAVIGILAVVLIMLIARKLFGSTLLAVMAGFLLAIDGHAIVMSRVAILDNSVMFFALVGFGAILLDRDYTNTRIAVKLRALQEKGTMPDWGPVLWWRPWLLVAGIAFGATCAVKWSGLYFLAFFGVYVIVVDALNRRRLGIPFWLSAAVLKQGPIAFILMVPIAFLVYLSSWTGWLVTSGGYYRDFADQPGNAWTGTFAWVPHALQSLLHYHESAYSYHVGLHEPHPYMANPLGWLLLLRPTSMYYQAVPNGDCFSDNCVGAITSIANPLIWWTATAAILYLVYRLARYREWRVGLILMGMAAGYLPWLLYLGRTVFQFYTIAFEPYMILGLVFTLGLILGKRTDERYRRTRGIGIVGVFIAVATLLSAFWYPLWTGTTVPYWFWLIHEWIPSWI